MTIHFIENYILIETKNVFISLRTAMHTVPVPTGTSTYRICLYKSFIVFEIKILLFTGVRTYHMS